MGEQNRNYRQPRVERGFYDDYQRGYYDREIEKSKDSGGRGRDSLFKDRRTSSSSRHKSESDHDHVMALAEETSSVTSVEMLPLEEPEPEIPKRKIIRVTKAVKLRDFTN